MKKLMFKKSDGWIKQWREKNSGEWRVARFLAMTTVIFLSSVFCLLSSGTAYANNLVVENIALTDKDTGNHTYDIKFDIAWDNSWFIDGAPSATANWDAAWVFVKFSKSSNGGTTWSNWAHCTLLNTGNSVSTGSQMSFGATAAAAYVGVFMYRASAGSGSVDWNNSEIRWAYGTDLVSDTDIVKIKVFGIEMVYIPQGSFYVGDGTTTTIQGQLEAAVSGAAFQITGEGALTLGGGGAGSLGNNNASGMATADDFNDTTTQTLPAAFPKGTNAFYMMKYEVSQGQYCNFLNTLTTTQAANRKDNQYGNYRNYIKLASNGKYGCDANNDAGAWGAANWFLLNGAADGQWIACNYLSWADLCAYADWAGLRPFTELEYEKACRGGQAAVADAYAWGNTTLESATASLTNVGTISETPNQGNLNYSSCTPDGPFRVGSYADSSSTRTNAGAGYYGGLDLSGSLWERPVTIGNATGRAFTGGLGNGVLDASGNADVANWPGTGATGAGHRGGSWSDDATGARVSDRGGAAGVSSDRDVSLGARAVRTP